MSSCPPPVNGRRRATPRPPRDPVPHAPLCHVPAAWFPRPLCHVSAPSPGHRLESQSSCE
eukprot:2236655-Prymnesium_polylepis.1